MKTITCKQCKREVSEEDYNKDYDKCEDCAFLDYDKEPVKDMKIHEWTN